MQEAALYADRLSVNLEIPTESGLKLLAPEKNREDMLNPMRYIQKGIIQYEDEKKILKKSSQICSGWTIYADDCRGYE